MPSHVLSTMASRAKAHHESLNAAFSTYYAPGSNHATPSPSTDISRSSSIAKPSSTTSSKKAPTNASKAWAAIKKHHREMNEAYQIFYSPGVSAASSRNTSAASSPRHSADAPRHETAADKAQSPRNATKLWNALKTRVVEHHRSVNAAYASVYGIH